ncbi:MAG: DUF1549 domain-containing protein, partial [Pirellulaceae bacterium]|nr:DUF1549 domain-containing protein [Pirellulaceae bacterium]
MDFFESKIRPVLVKECYSCHSAQAAASGKLRGQLLLDSRDGLRKGGESGPAVVAGKPDDSLLIGALRHETFEMPPKGKLADPIIADFVRWVEMGAPDPREGIGHAEPKSMDVEVGKNFWSFQKLALTPELQSIADGRWTQVDAQPSNADIPLAWARTPVDHFILQKLQQQKLTPNGNAHPRILVRRAWFDLLGLPPTPEEMEHWVQRLTAQQQPIVPKKDQQADHQVDHQVNHQAWSQLIDHLLMSPHYGERWARHWMDVARFAESHGYEQDYDRPTAYHYRDFLIQAFNSDMPYDQFVRWQLAGDQLAPDQPLAWMATGFLGGGAFPTQLTENEFESARYDELDDMVATTGVAFLGLSVGCARCHDHKFDPI